MHVGRMLRGLGQFRDAHCFCVLPEPGTIEIGAKLGASLIGNEFSVYGNGAGLTALARRIRDTIEWCRGEWDPPWTLDLDEISQSTHTTRNIEMIVRTKSFGDPVDWRGVIDRSPPLEGYMLGVGALDTESDSFQILREDEKFFYVYGSVDWLERLPRILDEIAQREGERIEDRSGDWTFIIENDPAKPPYSVSTDPIQTEPYVLPKWNPLDGAPSLDEGFLRIFRGGRYTQEDCEEDAWVEQREIVQFTALGGVFRALASWMFSLEPEKDTYVVVDSTNKKIETGRGVLPVKENPRKEDPVDRIAFQLTEDGNWCGLNESDLHRRFSLDSCPCCIDVSDGGKIEPSLAEDGTYVLGLNWVAWLTKIQWFSFLDFVEQKEAYEYYGTYELELMARYDLSSEDLPDGVPTNVSFKACTKEVWDSSKSFRDGIP